MTNFNYSFLFGIVGLVLGTVSAVTDDERTAMRAAALPMLIACGSEHGVTKEQVLTAKEAKNPDTLNPCFYACFFKKTGIMNEKGLFEPDSTLENHKKYIHDPEDLKKISEIGKICSSDFVVTDKICLDTIIAKKIDIAVNEKTVGDGVKGCERSKLLVHCLLEHKTAFTPFSA